MEVLIFEVVHREQPLDIMALKEFLILYCSSTFLVDAILPSCEARLSDSRSISRLVVLVTHHQTPPGVKHPHHVDQACIPYPETAHVSDSATILA